VDGIVKGLFNIAAAPTQSISKKVEVHEFKPMDESDGSDEEDNQIKKLLTKHA